MGKQVYWLINAEWQKIVPLLPRGTRIGSMIACDQRHHAQAAFGGARWCYCPEIYDPYTTVYNRSTVGATREFGHRSSMR